MIRGNAMLNSISVREMREPTEDDQSSKYVEPILERRSEYEPSTMQESDSELNQSKNTLMLTNFK